MTGIYFAKVFVIQIFELTQLISNGYSIGHPPFCETGSECNYIHSMSDSRVSMRLGVNLFHHWTWLSVTTANSMFFWGVPSHIISDQIRIYRIRCRMSTCTSGYWLSPPRIKEFCVEIDQSTMFNLPFSQTDKHRNQIADVYCSKATTKMFAFELDSIDLCSMHSSLRWAGNYHLNSHHYAFSPRVQTVVVQTIALGHSCGTSSHSANTEKWTRQLWLQSSKIGGSLGLWASNRHSFDWHAFALERKLES